MNRVNIETSGPIMENLCQIEISDDYDSDSFYLDNEDVENARSYGVSDLIALVSSFSGTAKDILRSALVNESPVNLDGDDVDIATLRDALDVAQVP